MWCDVLEKILRQRQYKKKKMNSVQLKHEIGVTREES